MDFGHFLSLISSLEHAETGGIHSHLKMIPKERSILQPDEIAAARPRKAAVMALFYPYHGQQTHFLLIRRADYPGTHGSQIGFPGGKFDDLDTDLMYTAIRETEEEVGVPKNDILIKKTLTDTYIPPSNFLVRPFIGIAMERPNFILNHEVEAIVEVQLRELMDPASVAWKNLDTSYSRQIDVPCFMLGRQTVWGATAMMLSEIKDLLLPGSV